MPFRSLFDDLHGSIEVPTPRSRRDMLLDSIDLLGAFVRPKLIEKQISWAQTGLKRLEVRPNPIKTVTKGRLNNCFWDGNLSC